MVRSILAAVDIVAFYAWYASSTDILWPCFVFLRLTCLAAACAPSPMVGFLADRGATERKEGA